MQSSQKVSFFNPKGRSQLGQFKSHSSLSFQKNGSNTDSTAPEGDWSARLSNNIGSSRKSDMRLDPNSSEERLFKIRKQKQSLERNTEMLTNRIKILQNEEKKVLKKIKDTRSKVNQLSQIRYDKDTFYEQKIIMEIDYEKEIAEKRIGLQNMKKQRSKKMDDIHNKILTHRQNIVQHVKSNSLINDKAFKNLKEQIVLEN